MNLKFMSFLVLIIMLSSCVSKKKLTTVQLELEERETQLSAIQIASSACNKKIKALQAQLDEAKKSSDLQSQDVTAKQAQIKSLENQIEDLKQQRKQQYSQVDDLTVLSKKASDNIGETIKQLEKKDQYINLLNRAKSKADSMNLALAVNLKSVLAKGVADEDIDVQVDKTVVYVNLSDKMLFNSGSSTMTPRANEVLSKIAQIIKSRPDLELMVEGYTDNVPIKNSCMDDNWDLSVKRSTAVVRVLQTQYGVNPNKLIAAGRGEYNALADNSTAEGRATNRRTRIILLPKLGQFYDLLDPANVPK